ncbi:MAG: hypothetical protein IT314_12520 [Anaerolineales bacterium]|nr:hypothetical protein [Anaerolineales bacterium]
MSESTKISAIIIVFVLLIAVLTATLPPAVDWRETFRPAALEILHGRSPYTVEGFYNPIWALFPLLPLAWLPETVGRAILVLVGLAVYAFVAHRLGAKTVAVLFLLVSPPVFHAIFNGNIDWMAVIGFVMPPQIGIAVAPFWLIESWRQGGAKQTIKTFAPFLIAFLASLLMFGLWPLGVVETGSIWGSASLWPMSIPVGLALFVTSIRKQKIEYAMAASPCLSPYLLLHSWVGALLAIVSSVPETIAAVVGLWILVAIRFFG